MGSLSESVSSKLLIAEQHQLHTTPKTWFWTNIFSVLQGHVDPSVVAILGCWLGKELTLNSETVDIGVCD